MDDNTRPHHAIVAKRYLQQETIERRGWSVKIPDLRDIIPMEPPCDIIQRRISSRCNVLNSLQVVADVVIEEWSSIPRVEFRTLIRSFQAKSL